jgi:hypothetical protein
MADPWDFFPLASQRLGGQPLDRLPAATRERFVQQRTQIDDRRLFTFRITAASFTLLENTSTEIIAFGKDLGS